MANKKQIKQLGRKANSFSLKPCAACVRMAIAGGMAFGSVASVQAELPVPRAVFESMGNASRQVMGNHMDIHQHTDRVILNWESFNVGKDHSVQFHQPGVNSIALNKIFQNDPSRILGSLTANGQVYLVNRNGFVFGKDSKVDVRGLVASTLDVSDEVFNQGITKVFASNGTAAFQGNGDFYLKNPDGSFRLDSDGKRIKAEIKLEEGAKIKTTDGQNILIIAPTITNQGTIEADDRQVILAAATDRVFLQEAGSDGLLVEVQTGGEINNLGTIAAKRGKVTLIGFAVNQDGKVSASTSLNINGTIRLLARENAQAFATPDGFALRATTTTRGTNNGDGLGTSATVSFGENSKTEILPELDNTLTAIDEQAQPLSNLEVMGHKVHFKKGSEVLLPRGTVDVIATQNPINPLQNSINRNSSRILVDEGAKIDVSGTDTTVKPMESNIIEVELRLNELKDSPLQRDGILFGKTILVDIRKGTPIADIQPDIDAVQRTLGERLAKGGEINLGSEGDTIIKNDATLDFSGGAVTYLDGFITTTKLTSNGRVFDISEAHPSLKYDGVYGEVVKVYEKWGVRKVWKIDGPFSLALRETGYLEGHDAGLLTIKSPNVLLEGVLKGDKVNGRLQRNMADQAQGGNVTIDMLSALAVSQSVIFSSSPNLSGVDLDLNDLFPVDDTQLSVALAIESDMLVKSGIQHIAVSTHGSMTISENNTVKLADGGSLSLQGSTIDVNGTIKGAEADVSLTTALNAQTIGRPNAGLINIDDKASIDLQGGWVNDRVPPFELIDNTLIAINGGSFRATANGDINLKPGSRIDVSGGAWLDTSGKVTAGDAGSMHLIAAGVNVGSNITLDGTLNAYGLRRGGTLELEVNAVAIRREREVESEGLRPLQIQSEFFDNGGFADYLITANINGLTIDEDVQIKLQQVNRVLNNLAINQANADSIKSFSRITTLPALQRTPSSLTLTSNHSIGPNPSSQLVVNKNALIKADPLSSVSLISDSALTFDGNIIVRGGNVELSIIPPTGLLDPLYQSTHGLWLSDHARIDVSGVAITVDDALGRVNGEVYAGGNIVLNAARGFVATKSDSLINASGTSAVLNLPRMSSDGLNLSFDPVTIGSNGGLISVSAAEGLYVDGQMVAKAGNAAGTSGGTLQVNIDGKRREEPVEEGIILNFPTGPGIVNVSQQNTSVFTDLFKHPGDALPVDLERKGYVSAEQIEQGGFSSLVIKADNEIRFNGDIDLQLQHSLMLDTPKFGWERMASDNSGSLVLNSAHAALGSSLNRTALGSPTNGDGNLTVNADLIELYGGSYTAGFNQVNLKAESDIRLKGLRLLITNRDFIGEFKTFSTLNLTADQVYPNTLSNFTLAISGDSNGTVAFNGGDKNRPVLSANSKLIVNAPNIYQNGIVKAPIGEIVFNATDTIKFGSNSITTVSAEGQIIPFGITEGGLEWLYPIGNQNLIIDAPNKNITFKADKIEREDGALVDLSGGGDLLAYEFIPGIGGSTDLLATNQAFAVIPELSGYAPFDPLEFPLSGLNIGDVVYLGKVNGLEAGYYSLLPAHYALLPGAYLITPQDGTRDMMPGSKTVNLEGAPVVAGFRAVNGTAIKDQRWTGFAVESGDIALTRSQFDLTFANSFFVQQAIDNETARPRLPEDAGHLIFDAKSRLDLPAVRAEAVIGGLPGLVDIVADNIAVVNTYSGNTDRVEVKVSDLDKFDVGSLLLGGTRTFNNKTGATELDVKSKTVTLDENTYMEGSEIILAATEKVSLKENATITAAGKNIAQDQISVLETIGDGALLRASTGAQFNFQRTGSQGQKGELFIGNGALVSAETGSLLLDTTQLMTMSGELQSGESLQIGAEAINLGEINGVLRGLSLDNAQLSRLNANELILNSRGNVNLYGGIFQVDDYGNALLDSDGALIPIQFGNLTIAATGFAGFDSTGKQALISANTVTLTNRSDTDGELGSGSGELLINADSVILNGGRFKLSGFNSASFNLDESFTALADTELTGFNDITIKAGYLTGASGSKMKIDAAGHNLTINQNTDSELPTLSNFAAELNLLADNINIDAPLLFRSGKVSADAIAGNVTLGNDARIDVSGVVVPAGLSLPIQLQAGRIDLISRSQSIVAQAGSQMLLNSTNSEMAAGMLNLATTQGQMTLAGTIGAHGGINASGGSIKIDTSSFSDSGFGDLNKLLVDAGFNGAIDLRIRNGDLTVTQDDSIAARNIKLTVDNGLLTVAGVLDAQGKDGGAINLAANGKLTLTPNARLLAHAQTENGVGGKVKLSSVEGGGIEIQNGALINVTSNGGQEGLVHLRAERQGQDVNISPIIQGTVVGDSKVLIEAVKIYNYNDLDNNAIGTIKNDTESYMNANSAVNAKFGPAYEIAPGIEVRTDGNMTLSSTWDLIDWRYGPSDTPGHLTLKAGGNVSLQQDLSDAFAPGFIGLGDLTGNLSDNVPVNDMLQTGFSWSYNIVAGADLSSADTYAVFPRSDRDIGDITLANNVKIRTGTGDINFYAGRDIVYGNDSSVVYTAGRPDEDNRFGFNPFYVASRFYAEYPLDGGSITFSAGRNINGALTNQLVNDWLIRTGNWSREATNDGDRPTAWGLLLGNIVGSTMMADYRQNLGALGGGNILITADGNINDLSVVIPTTGKQVGQPAQPDNLLNFNYVSNEIEINGGGNLSLTTGGDLAGGSYYVDRGTANLTVGGSLKAGSFQTPSIPEMYPVLALGDSQLNITAVKDVAIDAIVDPMVLPQPNDKRSGGVSTLFFRYSAESAVSLTSLAGNVRVDNDALAMIGLLNRQRAGANTISFAGDAREAFFANPASLKAYALQGNVKFLNSLIMYPSAEGQFDVFAANNITTEKNGNNVNIAMSDTDSSLLPTVLFPALNYNDANLRLVSSGLSSEPDKLYKSVPNHINNLEPALISTSKGNITSEDPLLFVMAKPTQVMAGNDIRNVSFQVQHNFDGSESIINSGRDLLFDIARSPVTGALINRVQKVEVSGPGQLTILAGRDIDLGSSQGITTVGNQVNPALTEDGANIDVISGLAQTAIDVSGYAKKYLNDGNQFNEAYIQEVTEHMQILTGADTLSKDDAMEAFQELTSVEQAQFNAHFFGPIRKQFNELIENQGKKFSIAKNSFDNTADEDTRFKFKQDMDLSQLEVLAAIESLFPGTTVLDGNEHFTVDPINGIVFKEGNDASSIIGEAFSTERNKEQRGDISMFFSRVHSTDGGNINLYAPNGGVNAGLAVNSSSAKDASQLGIVAVKTGSIHSIVRDDFQVNTTRVMTLGGGDIIIGSTDGNIDAGRGAKTALAAPPPIVRFDERGNFVVELPPAVAGSGIRANVAPDGTQGDALLFALQGIIDASEAGVGGKDVTVGATAIVGSDNIDVGGVSVGVPTASTGSVAAGLGNVANVAAAVQQAVESSTDAAKDASDKMASAAALGILSVDIIGFGDEEIK